MFNGVATARRGRLINRRADFQDGTLPQGGSSLSRDVIQNFRYSRSRQRVISRRENPAAEEETRGSLSLPIPQNPSFPREGEIRNTNPTESLPASASSNNYATHYESQDEILFRAKGILSRRYPKLSFPSFAPREMGPRNAVLRGAEFHRREGSRETSQYKFNETVS